MLIHRLEFAPERDAAIFAEIPSAPAVFLLRGDAGSEPYAGKTADLKRRLMRLLAPGEERSKRLNLRERCRSIEFTRTGSDFESRFLLYQVLREAFPANYRDRLKLRFAPLIKLNLENPYPRAYVTRRIAKLPGKSPSRYYGPFPSRAAAEKFMNAVLDFFKMRRCDFELSPDPAFPGCMYSEMKMCLAPCFKGCTDAAYTQEVRRVQEFFESGGQSLLRELESQREQASQDLQFEAAAALHARMEKVRGLLGAASLPEIVCPLDTLHAVMVQPSAERNCVSLFRIVSGLLTGPMAFSPEEPAAQTADHKKTHPRSLESRIAECLLATPAPQPKSALELNEHLALLKRWYFSSRHTGEIFFADEHGTLPLRRIVRGVGRVLKGEKAEVPNTDESHRAYWLARTRETTE